ncbi:hypothetical protein [Bradyrhizobium sp. CCBAU 51765]|uniref:hypothetical protein n=1 Tax=Bradyrhizobium sp. CCBAU 51765 TaxID=1325102 RepID=UPI001AEE5A28|nr:hypothetical protein [Bradyrhizobium sp. CCBAU 51765]
MSLTDAPLSQRSARFLQIAASPSVATEPGLHVVVLSLVPDTFYRLDAPIDKPVIVPTADVIEPAALDLPQLGFVGYSQRYVVPVHVRAADGGQPSNIVPSGTLSASVTISTFATDILWRWKRSCPLDAAEQKWNKVRGADFAPNSPISFEIRVLPKTPCPLEIAVKTTADGWISQEWPVNAAGF